MAADVTNGDNIAMLSEILNDISDYISYINIMSVLSSKEQFDRWHQVCKDSKTKISISIERYKEKYIKA